MRTRRSLTDSLSGPMIIGNGPINIMPAPFVSCFVLTADIVTYRKKIANPMRISITPAKLSEHQSGKMSACLNTEKSKQLKFKLTIMLFAVNSDAC